MRILITGGDGMVGRNLREHSAARRHEIFSPSSEELDLRCYQSVESFLNAVEPEMVIHAAGKVGGIQANLREPVHFLLDNLDIGRNIVWASRKTGIRKLINLGSSCMYPRNAANPLIEDSILNGRLEPTNEGYALAKIVVARLCEYIGRESGEYQYKTLIPCNIYGRYDKFDPHRSHMVPAIISKLHFAREHKSTCVDVWGDGTARREFMYADDLSDCIWRGVESFDSLPPTMNVGLGYDWTVNEYYSAAADVVGYSGQFVHDLTKPVGMNRKLVSVEKSREWGWEAKTSLHEGLAKTYEFFLTELS
jgi:GDP-L-fucose synthase